MSSEIRAAYNSSRRFLKMPPTNSMPAHRLLCSTRLGLAVIAFFGFANIFAQRINLSVALVSMLNHTAINHGTEEKNTANGSCSAQNETELDDGPFAWEKKIQGFVLGAFFMGYMTTQIIGGFLSVRFGGKIVMFWAMLLASTCTLILPLAAHQSYVSLIIMRVIIGFAQGTAFPCMHTIWSHWAPPMERSILTGFSHAGSQFGSVVTLIVSGYICDYFGWSFVFYTVGGVGIVWCCVFYFLVTDRPEHHKWITVEEKIYIQNSLNDQFMYSSQAKSRTPWASILTSMPVWAIVIAHACGNFGVHLVLTTLPTFINEVLNFDIKSNGLISACPYVAILFSINFACQLADFLIRKRIMSITKVRKMMLLIALCGQSAFFIATGYVSCGHSLVAVILITAAQGISGLQVPVAMVNQFDIAPKYAGTLLGFGTTFATVPGIVAPYIAAVLTKDGTIVQWRSVFFVSAAVLTFGAVFFAIFGSGEIQPWAKDEENGKNNVELRKLNDEEKEI